jgi:hypothetical protein
MGHGVAVGVAGERAIVRDVYAAETERAARHEAVRIVAEARAEALRRGRLR